MQNSRGQSRLPGDGAGLQGTVTFLPLAQPWEADPPTMGSILAAPMAAGTCGAAQGVGTCRGGGAPCPFCLPLGPSLRLRNPEDAGVDGRWAPHVLRDLEGPWEPEVADGDVCEPPRAVSPSQDPPWALWVCPGPEDACPTQAPTVTHGYRSTVHHRRPTSAHQLLRRGRCAPCDPRDRGSPVLSRPLGSSPRSG